MIQRVLTRTDTLRIPLSMTNLQPIYAVWNHNAEAMATAIGEPGVKVRQWRNRNSIPSRYWDRIIREAAAAGVAIGWHQFQASSAQAIAPAPVPAEDDGRSVTCSVCDLRLDGRPVGECAALDCPQHDRDAA